MKYIRIIALIYLAGLLILGWWSMHGYPTGQEPFDVQMQMWHVIRLRHTIVTCYFAAGFLPLKIAAILLKH